MPDPTQLYFSTDRKAVMALAEKAAGFTTYGHLRQRMGWEPPKVKRFLSTAVRAGFMDRIARGRYRIPQSVYDELRLRERPAWQR